MACTQEILVLLQHLKSSLLNIRNTLLSEPHLTPGRRSVMMMTGENQENWTTQPVRLWYAKKVKDISLGTRMAGGIINRSQPERIINRRQLMIIATVMVRANNPNLLTEYGGDLVLTDKLAKGVLEKLMWSKRKGNTGKVVPSLQFLAEKKFTFQGNISALVSEHDIPPSLIIINIEQTLLSYVNTKKYTFSF